MTAHNCDRDMRNIELLPSGHYRVVVCHRGEKLTGTVATYEEALDMRDELKRQIVDGGLGPTKGKTAKDLGSLFLGSRLGNRSGDDDSRRWHKHIPKALWARKALVAVTRGDGLVWLKQLRRTRTGYNVEQHGERETKFLGWQTRKHLLNLARSFFRWAMDQEPALVAANPFESLSVEREDGDEDAGYQDGWYLSATEQPAFFATWDRDDLALNAKRRAEKLIAQFAVGAGLRRGELWCLHLADVHVDDDEPEPRVEVKYGSWDAQKKRYRAPKGRKGEKKARTVHLFGLALEAARAWKAQLDAYLERKTKDGKTTSANPLGLMFPTERGARRTALPRSWTAVVEAFGVLPRLGKKVWWHLLRHTCASSLISGWWGMRWKLESVSKVLGHTDIRTTQIYAHLAPSALQQDAVRAHAAYLGSSHGAPTAQRPAARKPLESKGRVRQDSNLRPTAPEASKSLFFVERSEPRGSDVGAFSHVLGLIADDELEASFEVVSWLKRGLTWALERHAANDVRSA